MHERHGQYGGSRGITAGVIEGLDRVILGLFFQKGRRSLKRVWEIKGKLGSYGFGVPVKRGSLFRGRYSEELNAVIGGVEAGPLTQYLDYVCVCG